MMYAGKKKHMNYEVGDRGIMLPREREDAGIVIPKDMPSYKKTKKEIILNSFSKKEIK